MPNSAKHHELPIAALAFVTLLLGGCASLSGGHGAVPENVANCRALSQQAQGAMARSDWAEAQKLLEPAILTCPENADARRLYAEALWQQGANSEAVEQIEAAIALADDDGSLSSRAGEMYFALAQFDEAEAKADRAIHLGPRLPAGWALRGRVQAARGNTAAALADYQRALSFSPNDPDLLLELAEVYRRRNQPLRALTTLHHLRSSYPPGEEPRRVLYLTGLAQLAAGHGEKAVESLYAASRRGPPTAEILCRLGQAEQLAGRAGAAAANVQQALALDPNHAPSLRLAQELQATVSAENSLLR